MTIVDLRPALIEIPMPQRADIAFAAFAPLPREFGEKDRQKLAVAVRGLVDGSLEYPRRKVFEITEGRTVQAALLPDGVLIRFVVPKANLTNGIALMEGLLRRPALSPETLDAALRRLQRGEPDYWTSALRPERNDLRSITPEAARALLSRVFNPSRVEVSVVGGFVSGAARDGWVARTADWRPLLEPRYPDISLAPEPKENPTGISTVELRSSPFPASDPALAARWLALAALGVGKGSSLFRDVRQVEGWSYRQEAILWPDRAGLVARLVVATIPDEGGAARAEGLRSTLLKAVGAWTEADRSRALAAVRLGQGPLWIGDGPVGDDPFDRAALEAYWYAKAGVRWNAEGQAEAMRAVSLEALKAEATALLAAARPIVVPGRGR